MKTLLTLMVAVAAAVSARAVYFTSAPASAASGESYTVAAAESFSEYTEVYIYKNGAFAALNSGWGYAEASTTNTDWGAQTVNYEAYSSGYDDYNGYYGSYAQHSVAISNPNATPAIEWSIAPAWVPVNNWYSVQAHGSDVDGNLSNVWVDRDWVPFAYGLGGDGYNSWVGNSAIESGPRTVTYQARSWDLTDAVSDIIQHTVSIYNNAPTITWTINPSSSWVNEVFNIQARGNDADGNLIWVRVWKNGEVFAWHDGGNGFENYTNINGAQQGYPGVVQFTAIAGDAAGAESPLIVHNVTIANHAPRNPTLTASTLEVWTDDGTRNWVDLTAHVEDQDRNLSSHTIWMIQGGWGVGPLNPLTTANTQSITPPDSQVSDPGSSNKAARFYPNTPGRLDFHTNGQDNGGEWSSGASVTIYVYSPRKDAAFVSQTFNGVAVTNPAQTSFELNNRQVVQMKVRMRNTGDYPWSAGYYPFKLKSVGANWGTDNAPIPAGVTISPFIPGQNEFEFVFNVTAPDTVGQTLLQWRMQQDLPQPLLFGALSVPITINVKDTLPPSAPSNVRQGAVNTGPQLEVAWNAATDNGPASLIRYRIELRRGATVVGTQTNLAALAASFTGLRSDTDYVARVWAVDGVGLQSAAYAEATIRTGWDPNGDDDRDDVTNAVEKELGLDWGYAGDVRVFKYDYDKANQIKTGPGGAYVKDAEGNIKKIQP